MIVLASCKELSVYFFDWGRVQMSSRTNIVAKRHQSLERAPHNGSFSASI